MNVDIIDIKMNYHPDIDNLTDEEIRNFNVVLGNICRAVGNGLRNVKHPLLRTYVMKEFPNEEKTLVETYPFHSAFAGQSGPKTKLESRRTNRRFQTKGLPWGDCFWRLRFKFGVSLIECEVNGGNECQDTFNTIIKNVLNSILTYNKKTRNRVKLTNRETTRYRKYIIEETLLFKICKPKSSLRELIKKRLKKRTENTLLKF